MNTPTQVRYPVRAAARTALQSLVGFAAVLPLIVAAIGDQAPGWLVPIFAAAVTISAVVSRVMAIPAVNEWLGTVGLSAQPKPDAKPELIEGSQIAVERSEAPND